MLYQITDATVSVAGRNILNHINFEISGREKIAVVGRNGAGKSTLLHLIFGELQPDRDDKRQKAAIHKSRALTMGMLKQVQKTEELESTVEELLLDSCPVGDSYEQERYQYEVEYDRIFTGFGFSKEDKNKKLSMFSGGEQTKIALIKLLLMKPDILLLDEPTNHLDIKTVEWLEKYMREYPKAVVIVSHDRFFLNRTVDVIYDLSNGKLTRYAGSYSSYCIEKQKRILRLKKAYERQQEEIKSQEQLIERFKHKANKASFARSRKKMLERMERIECPKEQAHIFTGEIIPANAGSKNVFEAEHLKVGYDKTLFELSFRLRRGQKIAVLGENGAGKTTLLKTIAGRISPISGKYGVGNNVNIGYFDQNTAAQVSDKNVFEHFSDCFPALMEKEVRRILGSYLFSGKDSFKKVNSLSGGERSRLFLAELLYSCPNFLVLDEPTNHCDIQTKETLESAFTSYKGTMLFVSHDRYFVKEIADALLVIRDNEIFYYPFGYEHYLERLEKSDGGDTTALRTAQEQMLITGLRGVPKAEKHRLKEISTQEAYLDWKFRPVREQLEISESNVCKAEKQLKDEMLKWYNGQDFWAGVQMCECEQGKRVIAAQEALKAAWAVWHECCLQWNDVWISAVPEMI
ncbi:MAG: ABC-F family ATP-binding cassette domain-containing protein [Eubacteriales bacterium]|nr:ABC-F family ATP-binding cassette domain-containing protein [Eubacteriales bacterium]